MKGKTFLVLLAAAGLLVALSYFRFGDGKQTGAVKMGDKLFAELPVNEVASVTIADSENRVTLVRGDKVWQVEERDGFPADFDKLRDTVVKLSRLKIGRSFTGSPESMARLSLTVPSDPQAPTGGKRITLKDSSEKIVADVILGQTRQTEGGGSGGQYLKRADADTVFLVDGSFRFLKTAPAEWLQKEVLNVKADEVASVTCYTGDARDPVYTLARAEKGAPARMTPVPAGRIADTAKIDQVFDALAPLTLDDVRAGAGTPPPGQTHRTRLVYHLYDGRLISIFPEYDHKDNYFLQVTAETSTEKTGGADAVESASGDGETTDGRAAEAGAGLPVPKTAQQINEELSPWIFSVKKWQFDSFFTQPASLLEEVKKEGNGTS